MHSASVTKKSLFSVAVCSLLAAAPAKATIYDEAVSGDLSNDKGAPTALTLTPGSNSVIGTVNGFPPGGTDPQDWVSFTIPTGFVMTSYVNSKWTNRSRARSKLRVHAIVAAQIAAAPCLIQVLNADFPGER